LARSSTSSSTGCRDTNRSSRRARSAPSAVRRFWNATIYRLSRASVTGQVSNLSRADFCALPTGRTRHCPALRGCRRALGLSVGVGCVPRDARGSAGPLVHRRREITAPLRIVYPTVLLMAALFVLAASLDHTWHRLLVAVIGAAAWYVLFFALNLASPRVLGFGGRATRARARTRSRVAGLALRSTGILRGQSHRGDHRSRSARDQADSSGPANSLWCLSGDGAGVALFAGPELLTPFSRCTRVA